MLPNYFDSEFCGQLPIHLTNLIQSYGILLVIDRSSGVIVQASENSEEIFGKPAHDLVQRPIGAVITAADLENLERKQQNEFHDKIPAVWEINGHKVLVLIHRKDRYLLVEIEKDPLETGQQETFVNIYQELKYAMSGIEATATLDDTLTLAAHELKRISGFDKVMIYRFDEHWNGTVVAEVKEPGMEAYVGLTFPASDIPEQARKLYRVNPYRFIPDVNYAPVKLFPVINPITKSFIDLSDCNLRSVASVHLEYLKNMNVTASMSTRIMYNDKLWGLISCHHGSPRRMNYELCSIFEMFSSILSVKVTHFQNQSAHQFENRIGTNYSSLLESVYKSRDIEKMLLAKDGALRLFSASGAAISRSGRFSTAGSTPSADQMAELLLWLHTRQLKRVYNTNGLSSEYEYAKEYKSIASGILVIPINSAKDEYLILYRPENVEVIQWGGNPHLRIQFDENKKDYHPRNSFKEWTQKVSGYSVPWKKQELDVAESLRSFIYEYETSETS